MFGRKRTFSRSKLLAAATKAQTKGKYKKAVAFYEELLRTEPDDIEVHRKAAPALARARRSEEACVFCCSDFMMTEQSPMT